MHTECERLLDTPWMLKAVADETGVTSLEPAIGGLALATAVKVASVVTTAVLPFGLVGRGILLAGLTDETLAIADCLTTSGGTAARAVAAFVAVAISTPEQVSWRSLGPSKASTQVSGTASIADSFSFCGCTPSCSVWVGYSKSACCLRYSKTM